MAVSTTLQNGSSVITWQAAGALSFELVDSNGVPIGGSTVVENGPSAWTSVTALADGGFSIIWDSGANAQPMAQNYSATGAAIGTAYPLSVAPSLGSFASTSLELPEGSQSGSGPWTTLLPNGDMILVTDGATGSPPQLLIQQFDPAGHEVGSDYVEIFQGLPGLGEVQTTALAGGGYVVTETDNQNYGGALYYDLFRADGTHVAGKQVALSAPQGMATHATASLPDGGFVMSWVAPETNGSSPFSPATYAVFAEEFRSDGSAATSAQMLGVLSSSYTAPEITALASGKYAISWTSGEAAQSASFTEQGAALSNETNDTVYTPATSYSAPVGPHRVVLVGSTVQAVTGNNLGDTITSNEMASTLIGGAGNDTLVAGHQANVLTGGGGADMFVFPYLPWNAGQITDFASGTDKIDVSAILTSKGYSGTDPFGDHTLTLVSDGHGGSDLMYNPPGAGSNGVWPLTIVDIDNAAPSSLNVSTDFITGYGASAGGTGTSGGTGPGTGTGSGTGTGGDTGSGSTTSGPTLTGNDTVGQILTAAGPDATFIAGHQSVVMTGDGGANTYVINDLPWNAGQITNFNPASDKIDVSAILQSQGYTGSNPFGDGTLILSSDGHGGSELVYCPPGAGANGVWPISLVDIDHLASSALNMSSDFITASGGSSSGVSGTTGGATGTGTGTGSGSGTASTGLTLTGNDTVGQVLTATAPNATFIAGHQSVVMTGDGGANIFVINDLPWNAGQITNFDTASDTVDVSDILQSHGYTGSNPFGDGTLSLASDGHGGADLIYNPPGAGSNGVWPILLVDIDHVTPAQFQARDWVLHH